MDHREDWILAVVCKCFMDDSKDSQQSTMLVCAGWIGERNDWLDFSRRWNKLLKAEGIDYFKTSEYKMLKGQFEKFRKLPIPDGRSAAKVVRDDLLAIIRSYDNLRSVGVCIPMDEWNTVASRLKHLVFCNTLIIAPSRVCGLKLSGAALGAVVLTGIRSSRLFMTMAQTMQI
jgi:hypothetical protein